MSKKFQRKIEDFICEQCNAAVIGNGYTNHCPVCLWSKHVDLHPGDRAAHCRGMMQPIWAFLQQGSWRIVHRCLKCTQERVVYVDTQDDRAAIRDLICDCIKKNK